MAIMVVVQTGRGGAGKGIEGKQLDTYSRKD